MDEKGVALIVTLVTAASYLCGYGFLYGYYQYFDIGIWELELSVQDILVHAMSSFEKTLASFFLVFVLAAFLLFIGYVIRNGNRFNMSEAFAASIALVAVIILIAFLNSVNFGRDKAAAELRLLNPFAGAGLASTITDAPPYNLGGIRFLHLATTNDTFFIIGVFPTGRDRWVGRVSRNGGLASFVYQDP